MSDYRAPVKDMRFVMDELAGYKELSQYPDYAEATPDMADAILEEAAKFAGEVLAPLNRIGDQQGTQRNFAKTHDQQGQQRCREYRPQITGVGHPEYRIAVDQQVTQGTATDCSHRGNHQHAEPVQMFAPCSQHAADCKDRNAEKIHQLQGRDLQIHQLLIIPKNKHRSG